MSLASFVESQFLNGLDGDQSHNPPAGDVNLDVGDGRALADTGHLPTDLIALSFTALPCSIRGIVFLLDARPLPSATPRTIRSATVLLPTTSISARAFAVNPTAPASAIATRRCGGASAGTSAVERDRRVRRRSGHVDRIEICRGPDEAGSTEGSSESPPDPHEDVEDGLGPIG